MIDPNASLIGVGDVEGLVEAGTMDVAAACRVALRRGFLLIGTVEHKPVHAPRPGQTDYDLSIGAWVQLETPDTHRQVVLRASDAVGPAIMCAIFGDFNDPEERDRIGPSLTDEPRPRFGWTTDHTAEERLRLHARPKLLARAKELGSALTGCIDVVRFSPAYLGPGQNTDHGQVLSHLPAETVGTFRVTAEDLPYDRIQAIDYSLYSVIPPIEERHQQSTRSED